MNRAVAKVRREPFIYPLDPSSAVLKPYAQKRRNLDG